jgi:hypothetical protein
MRVQSSHPALLVSGLYLRQVCTSRTLPSLVESTKPSTPKLHAGTCTRADDALHEGVYCQSAQERPPQAYIGGARQRTLSRNALLIFNRPQG